MTEKEWKKGLEAARSATREATMRLEKEAESPFAYACPSGFISSEAEKWLNIKDIPHEYLTQTESEMLGHLVAGQRRMLAARAAKEAEAQTPTESMEETMAQSSAEFAEITAQDKELVFTVEKVSGEHIITGITTRDAAEQYGLCHLTVIIAAFVSDGHLRGSWIVHDRTAKQWAKGKQNFPTPSWNFWGGHVTAYPGDVGMIGKSVPQRVCDDAARREISEECYTAGTGTMLEVWSDGQKVKEVPAEPYPVKELIPLGFITYADESNVEASYCYALPIPMKDIALLRAADDYMADEGKRNVQLPISSKTEMELLKIPYTDPRAEVCDAITRLWMPENSDVYKKLLGVICTETGKSQEAGKIPVAESDSGLKTEEQSCMDCRG